MAGTLPADWHEVVGNEIQKPYFLALREFVKSERARFTVFPPKEDLFSALKYTPYSRVKVVIIGQDPYHDDNQAHGLSFSVRPGVPPPPSLRNIFQELKDDLGLRTPNNGYLVPWAEQGVLMLNAVLTVRAHQPASHQNKGWETFTSAILDAINRIDRTVVFLLWGSFAQKRAERLDNPKHVILRAPHPSPLSASRGFFGCRHFSKANHALEAGGLSPINWQLPDL